MKSQYTEWFRFESANMPEDTFHVIRFSGTEGLNTLFRFTIDLVSARADLDVAALLRNPGVFTIIRKDGSRAVFGGYPAEMTQSGHYNGYMYYSVVLRPTFWKLAGVVQSRVFLNKTTRDAVTELLNEQSSFSFPHEFRLGMTDYPTPAFAMQYEESVYDYICWRLEEQGMTWHIEQDGTQDKLVFSDTPRIYAALPQTSSLRYSPPSGLQAAHAEEVITAFTLSCYPLPRQVIIRTYNWQNPNKPVVGKAEVSSDGLGDVYLTTETVETDAEAVRMARIRAEERICGGRVFSGVSAVPTLRPGFVFTLENHYNPTFNRDYFLTHVTHEGSQEAFLTLGLGIPLDNAREHYFYHNNFVCIESDVQFRPPRTAPRTAIHGVIHAFIDGAGSGARPELDEFGRYKVLFPFDISGRQKGNASCWLRMAQPQVGNNSGLSFPLLPGTEVTVTFLDGNPDRPVITGALANGETGSLTQNSNVNVTGMRTPGGNQLVFNDEDTKQAIHLRTASGRGLSMSAGSLDSATMVTDCWMKSASTMSAEVSSLGHTFLGGFKTSHFVSNEDLHYLATGISTLATSLASSAFDTASKAEAEEEFSYGADIAKIINLAVQAGVAMHDKGTAHKHSYSAITRATKTSTLSEIQIDPDLKKLVAGIVLSVTGQAAQIATESINLVLACESDDEYANPEYYESRKTAAIHQLLTSTVGSLIPEIITYVLMVRAIRGRKKMVPTGGILQEALENNISLVANGPVSMHTPSGILLNTGFAQKLPPSSSVTIKKPTLGKHLEKLDDFLGSEGASLWGTGTNADVQKKAINDLMENQKELDFSATSNKSYVALLTELLFEYATHRKSVTEEVHSQQAKTHWLSTRDSASSITLRTDESGTIKPGLTVKVAMEKTGDKHEILQFLKTADNPEATRTFRLSQDGFTLSAEKKDATSTLSGGNGDLILVAKEGGDDATITLGKAGITLTVKKKGIVLDDKTASIVPKGDVDVAGVHFKGNKITATEGSKLVLGGEVEIINSGSPVNVSSLNKQVTDLAKKVEDNEKEIEKAIEDLTKLKEAPAPATTPPATTPPATIPPVVASSPAVTP